MSEIEKQFFETFGIEKKPIYSGSSLYNPFLIGYDYPQITDSILLELICIINQICVSDYGEVDYYVSSNCKDLKQEIISQCNRLADKNATLETNGEYFKHQVQALFKENN